MIEQDPEPKFHVKTGRTIYLTIITQVAPEIAFPKIKDKTLIEASSILKNHNLRIGDTTYVADIARDIVLDAQFAGQSIREGRMITKGSKIDLILGNGQGANEVQIPDLSGLTVSEAKFALQGIGLSLGTVTYDIGVSDTSTARVITQFPGLETGITSIGSKIDLTLSNSIPTTPTTTNPPSTQKQKINP
ncbi:PASTA domain protein [compost metagenome]